MMACDWWDLTEMPSRDDVSSFMNDCRDGFQIDIHRSTPVQ